MIHGTLTLSDGRTFEYSGPRHHWKSRLMQAVPYGADYFGCTWTYQAARRNGG